MGTKGATQPNLAVSSSTGTAPGLPDTPSASASFSPGDAQSKTEARVKVNPSSTARRVTDRRTEPTLIGVKPVEAKAITDIKPVGTGMVGRRALPGLANSAVADNIEKGVSKDKEQRTVPPSPTRHARIPSTGNRALVMDVAQALSEAAQQHGQEVEKETMAAPAASVHELGLGGAVGEKRKSSYERYAAVAMPPLTEERTPVASPANTMPRGVGQCVLGGEVASESPLSSLRVQSAGAAEQPSFALPSSKVYIGEDRVLVCAV